MTISYITEPVPEHLRVSKNPNMKTIKALIASFLVCLSIGLAWGIEIDPYAEVNESWDRFGDVYLHILENYYTQLDQSHVMRAAIEGMIKDLDPYSQFYDEEGLRQLRQDTTGKFAGLGITVGIKDHYPVIIVPIEDTPASRAELLPGDELVEIDGRNTQGSSLDEVVGMLRGAPGSKVKLKVSRIGKQPWELTLEREIIKIKSVSLTEVLDQGIGYISLKQTRFSEDTSSEVEESLKSLKDQGVKGLILDLRGNPGGLLSQAVEVAQLLLPKGAPVVTVRERDDKKEEKKTANGRSITEVIPLVVMIDEGSASAAEIVAGAIQDNDRGIILGTTSYGKGSVQTIFDMHEADETALKLTTALYYTPSGRCIHRQNTPIARRILLKVPFGETELPAAGVLEILLRAPDPGQAAAELRSRFDLEDSAIAQILAEPVGSLIGQSVPSKVEKAKIDSMKKSGAQVFYTRKGRKVYGGGGITPDVYSQPASIPTVAKELEKERVFFDFAVEYIGKDTLRGNSPMASSVDAEVLTAFEDYIKKRRTAVIDSFTEGGIRKNKVDELRRLRYELEWGERVKVAIDSLEAALRTETSRGVVNSVTESYIRAAIKRELVLRTQGKRASMLYELESDTQVREAIELLKTPQRYNQLLAASGP